MNHLEGHVFANFLADPDLKPPFLALVVSGGHTSLLVVDDYNTFRLLGQTRDDAAGEAFDKIARFMGLPYPGGPEIERLAKNGDAGAIDFPRPLLPGCYDFSFSGLKSAVINYVHTEEQRKSDYRREDVAASFQQAIVDVLVKKAQEALKATGLKKIVLAGGVSANRHLQEALAGGAKAVGAELVHPTPILCTDNAVMIGVRGYYQYLNGDFADLDLNADPSLKLGE